MDKKEPNITQEKKPYGNYKVYHPMGHLMFYCHKKKFNWYLKRDLAEVMGGEEKSIQLNFEPKGLGEDPKFLTKRENICVVTGESEDLTKHHVIPTQYRQYFPFKYKAKNSGDVVVITREKHDEYEREADILKQKLVDTYITKKEISFNRDVIGISRMLSTINNWGSEIPKESIDNMYEEIHKMNKWEIDIDKIFDIEIEDFSKLIVERCSSIEELIKLWKTHFVKYANPKYLPEWWDPNHVKIIKNGNTRSI